MDFQTLANAQDVGQGHEKPDAVSAYDAQQGTYDDRLSPPSTAASADALLPVKQLPKAPDPSPFKIGNLGK